MPKVRTNPLPKCGDTIEVCRDEKHAWLETVTVEAHLPTEILYTTTEHGDEIYAVRANKGPYSWVEISRFDFWNDPEFLKAARTELVPEVGARVSLELRVDDADLADVEATVLAVDAQGTATLMLDSFAVCAPAGYWVARERADAVHDCSDLVGLELPSTGVNT